MSLGPYACTYVVVRLVAGAAASRLVSSVNKQVEYVKNIATGIGVPCRRL